jgi:hypothetical protein
LANWASGAFGQRVLPVPDLGTEFDRLTVQLGLEARPELWGASASLQAFAKTNRNRRYVPEKLLKYWGIDVLDNEI